MKNGESVWWERQAQSILISGSSFGAQAQLELWIAQKDDLQSILSYPIAPKGRSTSYTAHMYVTETGIYTP